MPQTFGWTKVRTVPWRGEDPGFAPQLGANGVCVFAVRMLVGAYVRKLRRCVCSNRADAPLHRLLHEAAPPLPLPLSLVLAVPPSHSWVALLMCWWTAAGGESSWAALLRSHPGRPASDGTHSVTRRPMGSSPPRGGSADRPDVFRCVHHQSSCWSAASSPHYTVGSSELPSTRPRGSGMEGGRATSSIAGGESRDGAQ